MLLELLNPHRFGWSVLLVCALAAALGGAAELAGTVRDQETNLPLAGAEVRLSDSTGREASLVTGPDGAFRWPGQPAGRYEIDATLAGYQAGRLEVVLGAVDQTGLELRLSRDVSVLEEVVVIGKITDFEAEVQTGYVKLDRKTLSEIPSVIEDDPLRALQTLPGVQAASDISSGLYIRGGGPDQNLVLMEGATVYNPTHAFGFFSTFNGDAVTDLSLYKGAYPATYGGRLGGVLDVEMVQETTPDFHGKVALSLISARVFVEGQLDGDYWWGSARRSFLEPVLGAIRTDENPIPDWYFYDMNAGYTSYRGGGMTRLLFYRGRDEVAVDADVNTGLTLGWGNTVALLSHERFIGDNLEGRLSLSHSRYDSETDAEILATNFNINNRLRDTTLAARLDWSAAERHQVVSGLSYAWYDFNYSQVFNLTAPFEYGSQPGELAAYVEDNWFVDDLSTVRGGMRYRYLSEGDRQWWEPRLALSRQVRPDLRLKVSGGIYNQYLQLVSTEGFSSGDFYVPIDETADPGRSWQAVVGADWKVDGRTDISVEAYNTGLENLVALDQNQPVDQNSLVSEDLFVTEGKGYARGLEVFLRHKREQWSGWVGYTLGWTRRSFAEINGGESFVPKYDRRHDLNLLVSRQTGSWRLSAAFRYATGQAFTPAASRYQLENPATGEIEDEGQILSGARNSARLLPYHRLDVSARRPITLFGLRGEFVAEVFNLYNRRNEWFVQYDTEENVTEATVVRMLPLIPSVGVTLEF